MALITADYFNTNMTTLGLKEQHKPKAEAIDQLILDATEWVEDYCKRVIERREITEVVRGRGYNRLILDNYPIASVATIDWADDLGTTGSMSPDSVRILPGGILEGKTAFSDPFYADRTYTVKYTAGYDPIPDLVKRATALKVVDLMDPMYAGSRETRPAELVTNIETKIADLLEKYRRDRIG